MDRHLIPVEISVVSCAHQGVQLDRLSFYENRLKRLDAEPM